MRCEYPSCAFGPETAIELPVGPPINLCAKHRAMVTTVRELCAAFPEHPTVVAYHSHPIHLELAEAVHPSADDIDPVHPPAVEEDEGEGEGEEEVEEEIDKDGTSDLVVTSSKEIEATGATH